MNWVAIGMLLVFLGMMIMIFGSMFEVTKEETKVERAGIIMLGPIPLVWGTDKRLILPLILFVIILMVFWFMMR
ncbi:MAG: DUF131 domain-containing protein [Candidatus Diapherotrites archaeon]|nr:DUF131 domain-containing protein [Candidatus Diapherotrites archaeon]